MKSSGWKSVESKWYILILKDQEVKREGRVLWTEGTASRKLRDREGGRMCRQTDEQVG